MSKPLPAESSSVRRQNNRLHHLALQKLDDIDELCAEMVSALRLTALTKRPIEPWQFENCAKRLRAILDTTTLYEETDDPSQRRDTSEGGA